MTSPEKNNPVERVEKKNSNIENREYSYNQIQDKINLLNDNNQKILTAIEGLNKDGKLNSKEIKVSESETMTFEKALSTYKAEFMQLQQYTEDVLRGNESRWQKGGEHNESPEFQKSMKEKMDQLQRIEARIFEVYKGLNQATDNQLPDLNAHPGFLNVNEKTQEMTGEQDLDKLRQHIHSRKVRLDTMMDSYEGQNKEEYMKEYESIMTSYKNLKGVDSRITEGWDMFGWVKDIVDKFSKTKEFDKDGKEVQDSELTTSVYVHKRRMATGIMNRMDQLLARLGDKMATPGGKEVIFDNIDMFKYTDAEDYVMGQFTNGASTKAYKELLALMNKTDAKDPEQLKKYTEALLKRTAEVTKEYNDSYYYGVLGGVWFENGKMVQKDRNPGVKSVYDEDPKIQKLMAEGGDKLKKINDNQERVAIFIQDEFVAKTEDLLKNPTSRKDLEKELFVAGSFTSSEFELVKGDKGTYLVNTRTKAPEGNPDNVKTEERLAPVTTMDDLGKRLEESKPAEPSETERINKGYKDLWVKGLASEFLDKIAPQQDKEGNYMYNLTKEAEKELRDIFEQSKHDHDYELVGLATLKNQAWAPTDVADINSADAFNSGGVLFIVKPKRLKEKYSEDPEVNKFALDASKLFLDFEEQVIPKEKAGESLGRITNLTKAEDILAKLDAHFTTFFSSKKGMESKVLQGMGEYPDLYMKARQVMMEQYMHDKKWKELKSFLKKSSDDLGTYNTIMKPNQADEHRKQLEKVELAVKEELEKA